MKTVRKVSIPDDIDQKMRENRNINWSAVAAEAFAIHLIKIEQEWLAKLDRKLKKMQKAAKKRG